MVERRRPAEGRAGDEVRLVVASNRLPVVLNREENGGWDVQPGSGGLVTALSPLLRRHGGRWVGWPGTVEVERGRLEELLAPLAEELGYDFVPVPLSREERDDYYYGFSNEVLWPLLHDLQSKFRFVPAYWDAYRTVNRRFARVLADEAGPEEFVWVHDYHLMAVAEFLRRGGHEGPVGYFLHTPFPPEDVLIRLPWRAEILRTLLHYDLLGFQTLRDRRHFLAGLRRLVPEIEIEEGAQMVACRWQGRTSRVGAFPIGIDFGEFVETATGEQVEDERRHVRENLPGRKLVLCVSRLDYTKGIPNQLRAFSLLLERFPELRQEVSLVQVVVPSREYIPEYDQLREEVERLVGEINGQFGVGGWVPVHYLYRSLDRPELVAYYREADVALVAPLEDGMNLIAKEYCAARVEEDGVLVLSEFAGAAAQLQDGALLVNPHDTVATARALRRALEMEPDERRERMRRLREVVRREDVHWWLDGYLRAARGEDDPLPGLRDYVPGVTPGER